MKPDYFDAPLPAGPGRNGPGVQSNAIVLKIAEPTNLTFPFFPVPKIWRQSSMQRRQSWIELPTPIN
jgi:hypothetical protein